MRVLRPPASTSPKSGGAAAFGEGCRSAMGLAARPAGEQPPATGLGQQAQLRDLDVVGQRLAHVVYGQGRDRRTGQRLHFHTGAVMHRHAAANGELGARHGGDLDLTVLEPERMTERYELV